MGKISLTIHNKLIECHSSLSHKNQIWGCEYCSYSLVLECLAGISKATSSTTSTEEERRQRMGGGAGGGGRRGRGKRRQEMMLTSDLT